MQTANNFADISYWRLAGFTEVDFIINATEEVETGAGTATVTRVLSDKINKNTASKDRVSSEALTQRSEGQT